MIEIWNIIPTSLVEGVMSLLENALCQARDAFHAGWMMGHQITIFGHF